MLCASKSLIAYDDALARLLAGAGPLESETVALEDACGRVLAAPILAPRSRPCAPLAAMDGYAIRGADLERMSAGLPVAGAAYPGGVGVTAPGEGRAVRITTGAPVPAFADRVIVDEVVEAIGGEVRLIGDPGRKDHVRPIGSDFRAGDGLVSPGRTMTAVRMMLAAAGEAGSVLVVRRPRVAIVTTGDELAAPGACAGTARTPESASFAVAGLVRAWGGRVLSRTACPDSGPALADGLARAGEGADIVVVIGGASGSERDLARSAAESVGAQILFAGVALRPGKPVWAARWGTRTIIGLPGNPLAALITARLLLAPLLSEMAGRGAGEALAWRFATAVDALPGGSAGDLFLTAEETTMGVRALGRQGSSVHAGLASCNALIRRRHGGLSSAAGKPVEVLSL